MASPNEDSRGITNKEVGRRIAAVRVALGFDIATLAACSQIDVDVLAALEAGTRAPTLQELSDLAFALGVTITALMRPADPSLR